MWVGGKRHVPVAVPRERDPVPFVQEVGWDPRPVWTGAENLAPTGIPSPDRPARTESAGKIFFFLHATGGGKKNWTHHHSIIPVTGCTKHTKRFKFLRTVTVQQLCVFILRFHGSSRYRCSHILFRTPNHFLSNS